MSSEPSLYVGVMSGTSIDGADVILADLSELIPRVIGFHSENFPPALRSELLALNCAGGNEIERSHLAANELAKVVASAVAKLLSRSATSSGAVIALGCHGQTVRHRPDLGFTVQLNNPALLAELTRIDVVADFRSRDIAAGGQGAPLVPAFHDGIFRSATETRVVVNIGGIANLTILAPDKPAWGFDCGPGNCLMDAWISRNCNKSFDDDGRWAADGTVIAPLLERLCREPYFHAVPPKSTGRDLFHLPWLEEKLDSSERAVDVQATLLALTAHTIIDHVARSAPTAQRVVVCGGGARNGALMRALRERFSCGAVDTTDEHGVPSGQVEALAFAWLAKCAIERRALDLTATTGAAHATIYGAIYPA